MTSEILKFFTSDGFRPGRGQAFAWARPGPNSEKKLNFWLLNEFLKVTSRDRQMAVNKFKYVDGY